MISEGDILKLIDFGLSKTYDLVKGMTTWFGTAVY
jgi:serine/threonine protein kinase